MKQEVVFRDDHIALPVIEVLSELRVPLQRQTRGTARPVWRNDLLDPITRPADWYISLTTLDERVRAWIEPKAPPLPVGWA